MLSHQKCLHHFLILQPAKLINDVIFILYPNPLEAHQASHHSGLILTNNEMVSLIFQDLHFHHLWLHSFVTIKHFVQLIVASRCPEIERFCNEVCVISQSYRSHDILHPVHR